jgi:tRNA threonylcarbamoyladenosine biosynthesis protein TsaE
MTQEMAAAHALCRSVEETQLLAARLAPLLAPGDVLCLFGDLGAGKTCFTKGLVAGLGGDPDECTSPTFVLMQIHPGRLPVYHFDAYRLRAARDLLDLGSDEILSLDGVSVIEWADRVPEALPVDRLEIHFAVAGPTARALRFLGRGPRPAALVRELKLNG